MKTKLLTLLSFFLLVGCSKDETNIANKKNDEKEVEVNLPPENFDIELTNISHDSATINWNEADDPENDSISYTIYLNQTLIIENISELTFSFNGLSELTDYSGKIIAKDSSNNQTEVAFSFQTQKYFLKFRKSYIYGQYPYGYNGYAHGNPNSMIKTSDQNYVVVGTSNFPDGDGWRFFISKIDYEGNELWKKYYDYQVGDAVNFNVIRSLSGFILVGHHHILNLDNEGRVIWYKKVGSYDTDDGADEIKSVTQDNSGNLYLVGGRGSSIPDISLEAVLTKINPAGEIVWEKSFRPSVTNYFNDIIINESNEIIILGSTETSGATWEQVIQGASSTQEIDFWLLKLNTDGQIIWENTFGDGRHDFPSKIITKSDGNYVFAGYSWGAYNKSEGRVFKVDLEGNKIWDISTELSTILSIAETKDGGLITTGHVDFGDRFGALGLYRFSNTGSEEWNLEYQEDHTKLYGKSVLVEEDGGFRVAASYSKEYYYGDEKPVFLIYKTDPKGNYD